jgi:hypothetical protein
MLNYVQFNYVQIFLYNIILVSKFKIFFYFKDLLPHPFFYLPHDVTAPSQHHDVNALQLESNPRSPTSQGVNLNSLLSTTSHIHY